MSENRLITVAMPAYNATPYIEESIRSFIHDDRVSEVIVVDDDSADHEKLLEILTAISADFPDKIKMFKNPKNLGCLRNKLQSAIQAKNDWILLFDTDNIILPGFFDALYSVAEWDPKVVYAPEWSMSFKDGKPDGEAQNLDYRIFAGLTFHNKNASLFIENVRFKCLLNTCNWFINKHTFIESLTVPAWADDEKVADRTIDLTPTVSHLGCDSMFINTCLFLNHASMHVLENLRYKHRLHDESSYSLRDPGLCEAWERWCLEQMSYMR